MAGGRELKKKESKEKAACPFPAVRCAYDPLGNRHTRLIAPHKDHGARSEVKGEGQNFKIISFHRLHVLQLIKGIYSF